MPFSNTQYLYDHLPARFRRDDKDLLLKRFLQFFGETLDEWDGKYDSFFQSIQPSTANEPWISFWLEALFGWSWFPKWFTLADKRRLYGNFGRHIARRGTRVGIELFLRDFNIVARVHTRAVAWGEMVWGETAFAITEPLNIVIEILQVITPASDLSFVGEAPWGEAFYTTPVRPYTAAEIISLIRFVEPNAQTINVVWRVADEWPSDEILWGQIAW